MGAVTGGWVVIDTFIMSIDVHTLSDILVAHRRAMALYRKECMPLGRNAIEVMLYAYGKSGITATEVSRNLLHCNITQTKRTINSLVLKGVLWSFGYSRKGKPKKFYLSGEGNKHASAYLSFLHAESPVQP